MAQMKLPSSNAMLALLVNCKFSVKDNALIGVLFVTLLDFDNYVQNID